MTEALPAPPKLRLLRVFSVIAAVLGYCLDNFGRLFLFAWFACALYSLTFVLARFLPYLFGLEWPAFRYFEGFVTAPWEAMAWFFVLTAMADPNSRRGTAVIPPRTLSWLRFELNTAIWLAAALFGLLTLFAELTLTAKSELLVAVSPDPPAGDAVPYVWSYALELMRLAIMAAVHAWCLPLIGQVLRTGSFKFQSTQHALRGNWLRLFAVFLLLGIAIELVNRGTIEAFNAAAGSLSSVLTTTLRLELFRVVFYFPIQMLFIVVVAVTIGIVLNALDPRPAELSGSPRATA